MTYVVIVLCFAGMTGFLAWFLPRQIHRATTAEFNRIIGHFKMLCPVANGLMARIKTIECQAAQTEVATAKTTRELNLVKYKVDEAEEERKTPPPEVLAGSDGFSPNWT
jgi:hypothetical protein